MNIITNVKIYALSGTDVIENGFVAWENGTITALGTMAELPACPGAAVHDYSGHTLTPGFVDAHCHLGMWEDSLAFEGDDGNESTSPVTPHLRAMDAVNPQDKCFAESLAAGVTTVVTGPGSANPIAGQFLAMKTYGNRVDTMAIAAPCAMKFSLGENPKLVHGKKGKAPLTRMATAALIRETLEKARRYGQKKGGYDAKLEALLPVLAGDLPAKFHAHRADDICTALRLAKEFDLKISIEHATDALEIMGILKEEKIPINCGPILTDRSKPEMKALSLATPAALLKEGFEVAIITDHPVIPQQYLPLCAALLQREGVDEVTALKTVTRYPAVNCGLSRRVGAIAPGMDADMVLFPASPLSVTAKPAAIIAAGNFV